MHNNETIFLHLGENLLLLCEDDFLTGYLTGYHHFHQERSEVLTEGELYNFLSTRINDVHNSGSFNTGYITGYMAALTEVVRGDAHLVPAVSDESEEEEEEEGGEEDELAV